MSASFFHAEAMRLEELGHWKASLPSADYSVLKSELGSHKTFDAWLSEGPVQKPPGKKKGKKITGSSPNLHFTVRLMLYDRLASHMRSDGTIELPRPATEDAPDQVKAKGAATSKRKLAIDEDYDDGDQEDDQQDVTEEKAEKAEEKDVLDLNDMFYTVEDDVNDLKAVQEALGTTTVDTNEVPSALVVDQAVESEDNDFKTLQWRKTTLMERAQRLSKHQHDLQLPFEEWTEDKLSIPVGLTAAAFPGKFGYTPPSTWVPPPIDVNDVLRNVAVMQHAKELHTKVVDRIETHTSTAKTPVKTAVGESSWGGVFALVDDATLNAPLVPAPRKKTNNARPDAALAHLLLKQATAILVAHAGFDRTSKTALEVLADVVAAYFRRVTTVLRVYLDRPRVKHNLRGALTASLREIGQSPKGLQSYRTRDITGFGIKLKETKDRLTKRYEDILTNPNNILAVEKDYEDNDLAYLSGYFWDGQGFDVLGLGEMVGAYNLAVFHAIVSRTGNEPVKEAAAKADGKKEEEAPPRFEAPRPFPPINPHEHIGLLKDLLLEKCTDYKLVKVEEEAPPEPVEPEPEVIVKEEEAVAEEEEEEPEAEPVVEKRTRKGRQKGKKEETRTRRSRGVKRKSSLSPPPTAPPPKKSRAEKRGRR